ncbi:hypothetical protein ACHAXS_006207 [Conticribra weissflogii]
MSVIIHKVLSPGAREAIKSLTDSFDQLTMDPPSRKQEHSRRRRHGHDNRRYAASRLDATDFEFQAGQDTRRTPSRRSQRKSRNFSESFQSVNWKDYIVDSKKQGRPYGSHRERERRQSSPISSAESHSSSIDPPEEIFKCALMSTEPKSLSSREKIKTRRRSSRRLSSSKNRSHESLETKDENTSKSKNRRSNNRSLQSFGRKTQIEARDLSSTRRSAADRQASSKNSSFKTKSFKDDSFKNNSFESFEIIEDDMEMYTHELEREVGREVSMRVLQRNRCGGEVKSPHQEIKDEPDEENSEGLPMKKVLNSRPNFDDCEATFDSHSASSCLESKAVSTISSKSSLSLFNAAEKKNGLSIINQPRQSSGYQHRPRVYVQDFKSSLSCCGSLRSSSSSVSSQSSCDVSSCILNEVALDFVGDELDRATVIDGLEADVPESSRKPQLESTEDESTSDSELDDTIYFNNYAASADNTSNTEREDSRYHFLKHSISTTIHRRTSTGPAKRPHRFHSKMDPYQLVRSIMKRQSHEQQLASQAWNEVAEEYQNRIEPFTSKFVPHLLDPAFLDVQNKTILDVACGTGAVALYAAMNGAARVTATDFSQEMLEVLGRRVNAVPSKIDASSGGFGLGVGCKHLSHPSRVIETVLADGLSLPSEWTDQYDVVSSNFGVIYFPKVGQGLSEMVKCAKPGGRVCITGWGNSDETQAFSIFPIAMKICGFYSKWVEAQSGARRELLSLAGIDPDDNFLGLGQQHRKQRGGMTPNYFCPTKRIASSDSLLRALMIDAGLDDVQVIGPITHYLELDHAEDYWNRFVLASPNLKRVVNQCLTEEEALQLREVVFKILHEVASSEDEASGNGVVLRSSAYVAIGTKM